MFEAKNTAGDNSSAEIVSEPTALTKEEVADIIRLAETHGISGAAQVKLLLLARSRKKQAGARSQKN
jgi:hypothetical protein